MIESQSAEFCIDVRFKLEEELELDVFRDQIRTRNSDSRPASAAFLLFLMLMFIGLTVIGGGSSIDLLTRVIIGAVGGGIVVLLLLIHGYSEPMPKSVLRGELRRLRREVDLRSSYQWNRFLASGGGIGYECDEYGVGLSWDRVHQIAADDHRVVVLVNEPCIDFFLLPRAAFTDDATYDMMIRQLAAWMTRHAGIAGLRVHLNCARCGFDLYGSIRGCPECGLPVPLQWTALEAEKRARLASDESDRPQEEST